jgi:hypothetical protein
VVDRTWVEGKGPNPNHLLPFHKSCILHALLNPRVLMRASVPHRNHTPLDGMLPLSSVGDGPDLSEAKVESRPRWPISPSLGTSVPMKECSILHQYKKF